MDGFERVICEASERNKKFRGRISTYFDLVAVLWEDKTVLAAMEEHDAFVDTNAWCNIDAVATGFKYVVGLKDNGTVVAVGSRKYGRHGEFGEYRVSGWRNTVAIAAGVSYTIGLRSDGKVVAVGDMDYIDGHSQLNDIVAISAGGKFSVYLKVDGTVIVLGENHRQNTKQWCDIVAIAAGSEHTVGLVSNGTVTATGSRSDNRCDTSSWHQIVAIAAGRDHTVGLKEDGTVIAVGENGFGKCNTADWRDIVAVSASGSNTFGLRSDGKINIVGRRLGDFAKITVNNDRTVKTSFKYKETYCVTEEQLRNELITLREQRIDWRSTGRCLECGGKMSLFGRKCKACEWEPTKKGK